MHLLLMEGTGFTWQNVEVTQVRHVFDGLRLVNISSFSINDTLPPFIDLLPSPEGWEHLYFFRGFHVAFLTVSDHVWHGVKHINRGLGVFHVNLTLYSYLPDVLL